jgi:hypothetical protein
MHSHIEMLSSIIGELESEKTVEPPSIKEELERKTQETLEFLVRRHDQGRLSNSEFLVGVNAVWGVVAGLVERETMNLIAAAQSEVKGATPKQIRAFKKEHNLAIVSYNESIATVIHCFTDHNGKVTMIPRRFTTEELHTVNDHMEKAAKTILEKGYIEL